MQNPKLTAHNFAKRCEEITPQELQDGVVTDDNQGIVLKISARDWEYSRIVIYHQVSDRDVDLAIKKFEYVVRELDAKFA